jgi:hypothetical protein
MFRKESDLSPGYSDWDVVQGEENVTKLREVGDFDDNENKSHTHTHTHRGESG